MIKLIMASKAYQFTESKVVKLLVVMKVDAEKIIQSLWNSTLVKQKIKVRIGRGK